ncbi:MAG: hypothetical protein WAU61_04780 [Smithella sp.]|jgi:hypothetical protein
MRKFHLFKLAVLFIILNGLFLISGCSSSNDNNATANVVVQLTTDGTTAYLVDQMTVSIMAPDGSILTGVTDTNGVATITVTGPGDYDVVSVAGVDATSLAQGSTAGREFVKSNPLTDPYPYLTYPISGITVTVIDPGYNYNANITVPPINKVTVLEAASATSDTNGVINVAGVTAAFAGRLMISNLVFTSNGGPAEASIGIQSSDPNYNELVLYQGSTTALTGGNFYGGPSNTVTSIDSISYLLAGPVYFEAPGTDSGDWALGYNLSLASADLVTRANLGGAGATLNFPSFYGGPDNVVFRIRHTIGGYNPYAYSCYYRIFQFNQY